MSDPIRAQVGAPAAEISPDLWGLFLEDINSSLDGGLNAELVRNGDFEFSELDHPGWGPLTGWHHEGAGTVRVRAEDPVHPHNRNYIRATGPLVLSNDSWGDGVPVAADTVLRLSCATWLVSGRGALRATVSDGDGPPLAGAELDLPDGGWNWLEADLQAPEGASPARGRLRLAVPDGVVVDLDVISLRPVGPDGRVRTFRPDLVQALRELRPSFVRFPGGCVAHGLGLENTYHWKRTIGPRHAREQIPNLWGYHQSRQIGYLEFFELCELLGATPLPVVAAGVCCQNVRGGTRAIPEAEMPAYVQDVLDLVEFANGDPSSTWGSRRAELGHAQPFGLRYLGVGNEDEITDDFRTRYAQIEDALKAAHPEVTVIGTAGPSPDGRDFEAGWAFARERGTAVVDEHAYRSPRWYHQNVDRYESYPRQGGQVYFGEYAARSNRLRSALAEAAFMIGMERNGDVVRLASYAPLLARRDETQWEPDLIYFDADQVIVSANYHVQRLFAEHRGARAHEVMLDGVRPHRPTPSAPGTVRLSSPGSRVAWRDIVLDGTPVPDTQTGADGADLTIGRLAERRTVLELRATRLEGIEGAVLALGGSGAAGHLALELGSWSRASTVVNRYDDGLSHNEDGPHPWPGFRTGEPVSVRVELDGPAVRVWVDGELRHDYVQDLRPEHRLVVGALSRAVPDGVEYVVRAVNATDADELLEVTGPAWSSGRLKLLGGADPDAGAPFEPSPVEPVAGDVDVVDGVAKIRLPAWSFAVAILEP